MSDEETIFTEALAKPSPQERSAFLDHACGGNVELRQRVEVLLAALDRAGSFLESPPAGVTATVVDGPTVRQPPAERPGQMVGAYKLLEQIGEGGMGVVFMAEQQHPVRRRVALKIIKPGMDTKQVIARFEAERQALALMDHPNIARVLEAGATDAGRPYFVMELVKGIPITEYCDQQKLSPRQRLDLFVQVCQAVQHAHQKGIIHRDLKPNNVLVTLQDGKPAPKVIDFGIAKATAGQRLTDQTLYTELRQLVGTPLYISPEQAEMSALMDMDTRSDVYSLGVLLYELLTGTTPFDKQRLAKAAYDEVRRIIREEEPPRPSTRISTLGETLTSVSAQRQTDPKKMSGLLRGELDWIVMRALEKDRTRRYDTASGLAQDVERYLTDQPVEACPPSRVYRLRKFARRNKPLIMTTGVVAAVLILATAVSMWQAVRATRAERQVTRERDQARVEKLRADEQAAIATAVNEFLNKDVLGQASVFNQPARDTNPDKDLKVRDALDRAAAHLTGRFDNQPLVEAAIRFTIGDAYSDLGESEKGVPQLEIALRIRRQILGDGDADTQRSLRELAINYTNLGEHEKALPMLLQALAVQRQTLSPLHPNNLITMAYLGDSYLRQLDYSRAAPLLRQALDGQRKVLGPDHLDTLFTEGELAILCIQLGQYPEAESLLREVLERKTHTLGNLHPSTLRSLGNVGVLYQRERRFDEAEPLLRQRYEASRQQFTERSYQSINAKMELGRFYADAGQFSKGELLVRQGYETMRSVIGDRHYLTFEALNDLARIYSHHGDLKEAEARFLQLLEGERQTLGEFHVKTVATISELGTLYSWQGLYDKAESFELKALAGSRKTSGEEHLHTLTIATNVGDLYIKKGEYGKAESLLLDALAGSRKVLGEQHANTRRALHGLGLVYKAQKRPADVVRVFREQLEVVKRAPSGTETDARLATALGELATAENSAGNIVEAEQHFQQAADAWRGLKSDLELDGVLQSLGSMLRTQNRFAEAEPPLLQALEGRRKILGEKHPDTVAALRELGLVYAGQKHPGDALLLFRKHLNVMRKEAAGKAPDADVAGALKDLAEVELMTGNNPVAEQHYREAVDLFRALNADRELADAQQRLAQMLRSLNRSAEAEPLLRESIAARQRSSSPDTGYVAALQSFLGMVLTDLGKYEEAESQLLTARVALKAAPPSSWREDRMRETVRHLGDLYTKQKRYDDARGVLQDQLANRLQSPPSAARDKDVGQMFEYLGWTERSAGNRPAAEQDFKEAFKLFGASHADKELVDVLGHLVGELLFNKSLSEAEEIALETLVILRRARAPQEDLIANANANLGAVLTGQGRYDEAETLLLEAESEQKRVSYRPSDDRAMQFTLQKLQDLYQRWNKPDQFFKLLERKTAETTRALGATPSDAVMLASRGKLLARMGKFEDAKVDYLKAIELAPSQDLNWHDGAVPLLLQLDKPEEYVRLRTRELKQFANTSDLAAAHRVSKDCFMMPLEGEELDQAVALAARGKYGDDTWAAQTKGMADYRRGRFYDAIKWLKFSTDGKAAWKDVENNLFIALAYHYLGQHKEAQETLDGAVKMMETRLPQAGKADLGSPGDWIYCQIMRREAEREINGKDTSVTRGAASRPSTFPAGAADSPPLRADGDGVLTPPPPRPATSQPR